MIRAIIQIILFVLPWRLRRWALCSVFGYDIAATAKIGFSLILANSFSIGESGKIGDLTIIKGLKSVRIDEFASLGNLNWVTAVSEGNKRHFTLEKNRVPSLCIERHASITHRHLIDCTDCVTIGAFTTIGGWRSQILTHAIDLRAGRQSCEPITIGRYCFIGTSVVLLKGSSLPDKSVLAAGSVLAKKMTEEGMLYSGVPAIPIRRVERNEGYFTRPIGFVY